MIPKLIWQTYKTSTLPDESLSCIQSWILNNPTYQWYYMDDVKCNQFIKDHFHEDFYKMYNSLPYGVMKADTWRIAIIYIYGGIYADIDTVCLTPADYWLKQYELVVSYEPPFETIANYCFASIPKHPALYYALEFLIENYHGNNFMDKIDKTGTPIQNYGQDAFNRGIKKYFDLHDTTNCKLFTADENAFSPYTNEKTLVHHQSASVMWFKEYDSWRKEQYKKFEY